MYSSSIAYFSERFTTVPLRPGTKIPAVRWGLLKAGESQPDRFDTEGRAILTGERSGGLVVLDIDAKRDIDGRDGFARLEELESIIGPLPETYTVDTPSCGIHLYFQHEFKFRTEARILSKIGKVGNVDLRAEGGIVVAPGHGRKYKARDENTHIARLPDSWAEALPLAREPLKTEPVTPISIDIAALRIKLISEAKSRKGEEWATIRRALAGERMFRLQGGPGPAVTPVIVGVDEYLSKKVIWTLACASDFFMISPEDMATIFAPTLSILRADADACGTPSKFTQEYFADKWRRAQEKVAAQNRADQQVLDRIVESKEESNTARDHGLPWVVQLDDSYFVLDDNLENKIQYRPCKSVALVALAKRVWPETRSVLTDDGETIRPMTATELCVQYGTPVTHLVTEYFATQPRVDGFRLVSPPIWALDPPEPKEDSEVHEWLLNLGGESLIKWLVWAHPSRTQTGVPALALIGASTVGKTALAVSLARAVGQQHPIPLRSALQKHAAQLTEGPIIFADEGMPSIDGRPATEEFRALVTASSHSVELKGVDRRLVVNGCVRVILAANRADRLFNNPGLMNRHDVQALARRLLVIEIPSDKESDLNRQIVALGRSDNDPERLMRIAGHIRYLQLSADLPAPTAHAATISRALRLGTDNAREAIGVLEESFGLVDWMGVDGKDLWVELARWSLVSEMRATTLLRQVEPYIAKQARLCREHPVTKVNLGKRTKWICLDLSKLLVDGIEVNNG